MEASIAWRRIAVHRASRLSVCWTTLSPRLKTLAHQPANAFMLNSKHRFLISPQLGIASPRRSPFRLPCPRARKITRFGIGEIKWAAFAILLAGKSLHVALAGLAVVVAKPRLLLFAARCFPCAFSPTLCHLITLAAARHRIESCHDAVMFQGGTFRVQKR